MATTMTEDDESAALAVQRDLLRRFQVLRNVRPGALGTALLQLAAPDERRRIVRASNGLRVYLDPFTHLGTTVLTEGVYEADTERIIRAHLRPGEAFLDIGANEGYFSALAATIVGSEGLVVSIEPQSRLRDLIEMNLRINGATRFRIYRGAFGGQDGARGVINLWPSFNTGASSIARRYRFGRATEEFTFVSLDRVLQECRVGEFHFAKVDVEGFESDVIDAMADHLARGTLQRILLDFHKPELLGRGVDPSSIHAKILRAGYRVVEGDTRELAGYVLYSWGGAT
jgi:FkbM family methyltransferase